MRMETERTIVFASLVMSWGLGVSGGPDSMFTILGAILGIGTMAHIAHMLDRSARKGDEEHE